jgi:Nitric oxide reductase activation protein
MFLLKSPSLTFLGTLQTVARVATENWKLQVKWNNSKQSFTDCRTEIQLGWSTNWIMEGCSSLAEWTAAMKGSLEHEIAHNLYSRNYEVRDSKIVPLLVMESYYERLQNEGMTKDIAKFIENALEDGRVNRLHVNMSPKMVQTLRWIVHLIYKDACRAMADETNSLAWALNSFLGRVLIGRDLEGVPDETVQFLDSIQSYIEEGLFAESSSAMITKGALPIAEAFIDEFPSMFVPAHLILNLEYGKHQPLGDLEKSRLIPDRGVDVRLKPMKSKPIKLIKDTVESFPDKEDLSEDEFVELPKEENLEPSEETTEFEETEADFDFTELLNKSAEDSVEFSAKDEALEREVREAREAVSLYDANDIRTYLEGLHAKVVFKELQAPFREEWLEFYDKVRQDVSPLIDEASEALREHLVHQKQTALRNLRSGRIDPHRLWRAAGLLDSRIFMTREAWSKATDVAVYLLLDMSGSMSYEGRIIYAQKAAIILAEILETFGIAHTIVAFTADNTGSESVEHYRLVNWGEAEKHRLMFYHAAYDNRDGFSLRIATEELSRRHERAKILLMLSDGVPEAENYNAVNRFDGQDPVLDDVAIAVEEAKEKRVEVLHLYFGDSDQETLKKVSYMYPKLSVITDPADVPGAVADIVVSTLRKYM